jgi:GDP-L-fucose synthase
MNKIEGKIFITGASGFLGKSVVSYLQKKGYSEQIITTKIPLTNSDMVDEFFRTNEISHVIHLAAKVGGILKNSKDNLGFLVENLKINNNVFESAIKYRVNQVLNMGSSCIYPKDFPIQPMTESHLMQGPLEETNGGYAMAKLAALKYCQYANRQTKTKFLTLAPSNLYGPGDHYGSEDSHALAALVGRVADCLKQSKTDLLVWGDGSAMRQWTYVEDVAETIVNCLETGFFEIAKSLEPNLQNFNDVKDPMFFNFAYDYDVSMNDLAQGIIEAFTDEVECRQLDVMDPDMITIVNDPSKPSGMLRKFVSSEKINKLGFVAKTNLIYGLKKTVSNYCDHYLPQRLWGLN